MDRSATDKLSFDTQLLDVYLTGLQSEVEAKLRLVARFREDMVKIGTSARKTDTAARVRAARGLITRVDEMLATNRTVRETLQELRDAAEAVLKDLKA
jgi:pyrimidine operon attenuation protein/uracil phosphoribosyltransferase